MQWAVGYRQKKPSRLGLCSNKGCWTWNTSKSNLCVEDIPVQLATDSQLCFAEVIRLNSNCSGQKGPAGDTGTVAIVLSGNPQTTC